VEGRDEAERSEGEEGSHRKEWKCGQKVKGGRKEAKVQNGRVQEEEHVVTRYRGSYGAMRKMGRPRRC